MQSFSVTSPAILNVGEQLTVDFAFTGQTPKAVVFNFMDAFGSYRTAIASSVVAASGTARAGVDAATWRSGVYQLKNVEGEC